MYATNEISPAIYLWKLWYENISLPVVTWVIMFTDVIIAQKFYINIEVGTIKVQYTPVCFVLNWQVQRYNIQSNKRLLWW